MIFFRKNPKYVRTYSNLPKQTDFWCEVFHNGFNCDYYNQYFNEKCMEGLDHIYMILTKPEYQDAFKSVFEVMFNTFKII